MHQFLKVWGIFQHVNANVSTCYVYIITHKPGMGERRERMTLTIDSLSEVLKFEVLVLSGKNFAFKYSFCVFWCVLYAHFCLLEFTTFMYFWYFCILITVL